MYCSSLTTFVSDEWTMEDKILFEQAYSSHGKSFKRIQQIVSTPLTLLST